MSVARRPILGALAAALLAATAAGCDEDQTALLVDVSSPNLSIPADIDQLRFVARTARGQVADETFAVAEAWPHSLAILPANDDRSADVTLSVIGRKGGADVIRRVVETSFIDGETRRVDVVLTRACYGVPCPEGVDCVDGLCQGAPTDGGLDAGMDAGMDAGLDGGSDAGAEDAGPADAGPDDAGPPDAPPADACVPAGVEICNGMDDDCDGMIDEGLPCAGSIVISEVATGGPDGARDEFVELYNTTGAAIPIGNLEVEYQPASGGGFVSRASAPPAAVIPAHGYYLMGSAFYSRSTMPDLPSGWSTGFASAGGHVRITDPFGAELDRFAWGSATEPEGSSPFPELSNDTTHTYERKALETSTAVTMQPGGADADAGNGWDADQNADDFVARTPAGPQNTSSAAEAP